MHVFDNLGDFANNMVQHSSGTTVMVESRSPSSSELSAAESSPMMPNSGSEKPFSLSEALSVMMVDIFDAVTSHRMVFSYFGIIL